MKTTTTLLLCSLISLFLTKKSYGSVLDSFNLKINNSGNISKNIGQWENEIIYSAHTSIGNVRFLKDGLSFCHLNKTKNKSGIDVFENNTEALVWNLRFLNSNENINIKSFNEHPSVNNYINGSLIVSNAPVCSKLSYQKTYSNIDIDYYSENNKFKYDIVVHPEGNISNIKLNYEGIKSLKINSQNELEIVVGNFSYKEDVPFSYQLINGKKVEVKVKYVLLSNNTFGFKVISAYNEKYDLIIDPFYITWGTYVGDLYDTYSYNIAQGQNGDVYITGRTEGSYPTATGNYNGGLFDAYVAKLDANGQNLIYFTTIGGSGLDVAIGLDVDFNDNVYICGYTTSQNLIGIPSAPIIGSSITGNIPNGGQGDAFLAVLNSSGTTLNYWKYIGGMGRDEAWDLFLDKQSGDVYISGRTTSPTNFPLLNPIQSIFGGGTCDAFILKINPGINTLQYSSFFGGNGYDNAKSIVVDSQNSICIGGVTNSNSNFPVHNAQQNALVGANDGFIASLNPVLNIYNFSTYSGGTGNDEVLGIANNANDDIYAVGYTESQNLATSNVLQQNYIGNIDGFVTKYKAAGGQLFYTYLGGKEKDHATGVTVNFNTDECFVVGVTDSNDFPVFSSVGNNFQMTNGGNANGTEDLFCSHINRDGSGFACGGSSYIGGNYTEHDPQVILDLSGIESVLINSTSHSNNFPTTVNAHQNTNNTFSNLEDQPVIIKLSVDCDRLNDVANNFRFGSDEICQGADAIIMADIISGSPSANITIQGINPSITIGTFPMQIQGNNLVLSQPITTPGYYQIILASYNNVINGTIIGYISVTPSSFIVSASASSLNFCNTPANIQLNASGGAINYSWIPSITLNNSTIFNPIASPSVTTTYTVTGTDAKGCTNTDTITLLSNKPNFTLNDTDVCRFSQITINSGLTSNGQYSFIWYNLSSGMPVAFTANLTLSANWASSLVGRTYRLCATDIPSGCNYCDDIRIRTFSPCFKTTSKILNDNNDNLSFKVKPNPSSGKISLCFDSEMNAKISMAIYNQLGQIVYQLNELLIINNISEHDFSTLENGVYYISINTENKVLGVSKLIVQH